MSRVILDDEDAERLLLLLYHGEKPPRVHTLLCLCGARADLRESPHAWDGWQILPHPKCPGCIERHPPSRPLFPARAQARFHELVHRIRRR